MSADREPLIFHSVLLCLCFEWITVTELSWALGLRFIYEAHMEGFFQNNCSMMCDQKIWEEAYQLSLDSQSVSLSVAADVHLISLLFSSFLMPEILFLHVVIVSLIFIFFLWTLSLKELYHWIHKNLWGSYMMCCSQLLCHSFPCQTLWMNPFSLILILIYW